MKTKIIETVERGVVPDYVLRLGIRQIIKQRLKQEPLESVASKTARQQALIRNLVESQIAGADHGQAWRLRVLPDKFFELFLGRRLKFSSLFWPVGASNIDSAEEQSLALICERAGVKDGMRVIDFGCGWGSLAIYVAEKYPGCSVVALTRSQFCAEHIRRHAEEHNLKNLEVVIETIEQHQPAERYDVIFSIESVIRIMNWRQMMKVFASWLTPDGALFIDIYTHRSHSYSLEEEDPYDWMGRYFVNCGIMPSDSLVLYFQRYLSVHEHWRVSGEHYHRTAEAWLDRLTENKHLALPVLEQTYGDEAEIWFHRWRTYLLTVSEMFHTRHGNEWAISNYLFKRFRAKEAVVD